ncbi:MAG TPA: tetratricopeptide repeat protein [Polyangiaceae bacterium]|nr:tetratricopeptide repeat protein [Polyangiaceae bacterium]
MAFALACCAWLGAATARAQSSSDDLARRHFDSGVAYLEESDYDNALKAFQKAYDLSKRPEILLNVATVHERKSDLASAVAALKGYLEAAPQGEHVETVKLRIQNLEKRISEQDTAKATETAPDVAPAPPPTTSSQAPLAPAPAPSPGPRREEPNRMPAFISLGVGGVLAGASLVTGLVAKSNYDDAKSSCSPGCSDSQLSSSRTFAITSTVLTGAAVLGVGLGVALLLTTDDSEPVGKGAPRFDVALGPTAAAASAAWSF